MHLKSLQWLVLKMRMCSNTRDAEYSVHKGQNSLDENLCKSDAQVDIHQKLLLIKLNPAVFLLTAKD